MDETLTNTILAIVAVVGCVLAVISSFGSLIAFLVAQKELRGQRQETRELQRLASDLEDRVHRLATHLGHRIYRLERARDLVNNLRGVSLQLRQQDRQQVDKLNGAVTIGMALPELAAIVLTIGDEQLRKHFADLAQNSDDPIWPKMWNQGFSSDDFAEADQLILRQSDCIHAMHKRILELWEEATSNE